MTCLICVSAINAQEFDINVLIGHPDPQVGAMVEFNHLLWQEESDSVRANHLKRLSTEQGSLGIAQQVLYSEILYRENLGKGQTDAAFLDIRNAVQIAEQLPEDDLVLGFVYAELAHYLHDYQVNEIAVKYFRRAIRILQHRDSPDSLFTANIRSKLILAFAAMGERDSVTVYRDSTINYIAQFGKSRKLGDLYNIKGLYLHGQGDFVGALEAYQTGIAILSEIATDDALMSMVNTEESMAHTLFSLGLHKEAFQYLEHTLELRLAHDRPDAIRAWTYLMRYALDFGQPQRAYGYYTQYLASHPRIDAMEPVGGDTYPVIAEVLSANGQNSLAIQMQNRGNEILLAQSERELERLTNRLNLNAYTRYLNQVFEQELTINTLENSQLKQHLKLRNRTILGFLIISLLAVAGVWYYLRTKAKFAVRNAQAEHQKWRILMLENENLKYTIALKERDLSRIAADNKLRTTIKKDLLKKLREIDRLSDTKLKKALFLLIRELDQNLLSEDKMNLVQDNIHALNAAFEDHLKAQVPGITQSEVELCSLIRLGMNNHDIAQMLNKANSTIRVYKTRIKDKAGMHSVIELEDMLRTV